MKEKIQISPSYCKCGKQRIFQTLKEDGISRRMGYSCPKKRWWNFWKHDRDTVHAYLPIN